MRKVRRQNVSHRAHVELAPSEHRELGNELRVFLNDVLDNFLHFSGVIAVEFGLLEKAGQDLCNQLCLIGHAIRNMAAFVDRLDRGRGIEFRHCTPPIN